MRRLVIGVLIVSLAVGGLVVPALAQEGSTPDETNSTESERTLDDLRQGGETLSGAPGSVRFVDGRQFWTVYWPASAIGAEVGTPTDDSWEHLEPGTEVGRNSVYLRSIQLSSEIVHIRITTWERATKTVKRGNETVEEPYAANVTTRTHEAELTRGWPMVEVPLGQHNREVEVVMTIEEYPGARWRFSHESVPTTQNAGIQSEGDYLVSLLTDLVIWIIGGGFVVGVVSKKALDRAGRGPGYGYFPWILVLTFGTGILGWIAFDSLAEVLVAAPTVIALYVVGIFGIILLETYTARVRKVEFLQLDVEEATTPSGEEGYGWRRQRSTVEDVVSMPDGREAVVRTGVIPFLARVFGSTAELKNSEKISHRVKDEGSSSKDETVLVHPDEEEVLRYEPETFCLAWEDEVSSDPLEDSDVVEVGYYDLAKTGFATVVATVAVGLGLGTIPTGAGLVDVLAVILTEPLALLAGAAAFAVVGLTAVPGEALVVPAPSHMTDAYATTAMLAEESEDADTIDEYRRKYRSEKIRSERDVEEALDTLDETLVEEMFDLDLDRTATDGIDDHIEDLQDLDREDLVRLSNGGSEAEDDE